MRSPIHLHQLNRRYLDLEESAQNLLFSLVGLGAASPFIAGRKDWTREPIILRYTSHVPSTHGLYTQAFIPFAELVKRETSGRMQLEPFTDRLLHGPLDGFLDDFSVEKDIGQKIQADFFNAYFPKIVLLFFL